MKHLKYKAKHLKYKVWMRRANRLDVLVAAFLEVGDAEDFCDAMSDKCDDGVEFIVTEPKEFSPA